MVLSLPFVALRYYIGICTSVGGALRLHSQSDFYRVKKKKRWTRKNTDLFRLCKRLFATTLFSFRREKRNCVWTELISLARQRPTKYLEVRDRDRGERDREQTHTLISNFLFSVVVLTCTSSRVPSSQLRSWVWDPFSEFIPKWELLILVVFTLRYTASNSWT